MRLDCYKYIEFMYFCDKVCLALDSFCCATLFVLVLMVVLDWRVPTTQFFPKTQESECLAKNIVSLKIIKRPWLAKQKYLHVWCLCIQNLMMVVHIDPEGGRAKYIGHARSIDVATQDLLRLMDNIKLVSIACGLSCMEKTSLLNKTLLHIKEEYETYVCLCGRRQVCRGSFLNLTGEGAFQKVLFIPDT